MSLFFHASVDIQDDPKFIVAGPCASWMYFKGLAWSKKHMTDGFVPTCVVPILAIGMDQEAAVQALTTGEDPLWQTTECGYTVGSERWAKWQTTKQQVDEKREKDAVRLRNWRKVKRGVKRDESEILASNSPVINENETELKQRFTTPSETLYETPVKRYQRHRDTETQSKDISTLASTAKAVKAVTVIRLLPEELAGTYPLIDGTDLEISKTQVAEWQDAFPAINVMQQLKALKQWAIANPKKRKTRRGVMKHIVGCLSSAQDKPHFTANSPSTFKPAPSRMNSAAETVMQERMAANGK